MFYSTSDAVRHRGLWAVWVKKEGLEEYRVYAVKRDAALEKARKLVELLNSCNVASETH